MNDDDLSLFTANTGITNISTASPTLDGVGALQVLLAGGVNGTIVKSVIIKATAPTTQGMVRLFIENGSSVITLYKEVPIPIQPQAPALPVPAPHYTFFEVSLDGGLKLQTGFKLLASTQNAESFNIIAEGLDWTYPESTSVCCNFEQEAADTGLGLIKIANAIGPVFTAGSGTNGATITAITIKALQSTQPCKISLYISKDGGTTWFLMQEVPVPQTTQSAYDPSFKQVLNMNFNLQADYMIGAATDVSQSFAITVEATNWTYA